MECISATAEATQLHRSSYRYLVGCREAINKENEEMEKWDETNTPPPLRINEVLEKCLLGIAYRFV